MSPITTDAKRTLAGHGWWWLKRLALAAIAIGVLYLFLAEPVSPEASKAVSDEPVLPTVSFAVVLFLYIVIAAPIAYGVMQQGNRQTQLVKDSIWAAWLILILMIMFAYGFLFHPSHMITDGTDGPPIDISTNYISYTVSIVLLTLVLGLPAILYWLKRLFPAR